MDTPPDHEAFHRRYVARISHWLATAYWAEVIANCVLGLAVLGIVAGLTLVMFGDRVPTESTDRMFNPGTGALPIYNPVVAKQYFIGGSILLIPATILKIAARIIRMKRDRDL